MHMHWGLVPHMSPFLDSILSKVGYMKSCWNAVQVTLWRPAEILNGRMAMIGFTLGALTSLRTGQTVWAQLNNAPFAYLAAYGMVVLASLVNE